MKKFLSIFTLLSLVFALVLPVNANAVTPFDGKTIVIDPGHGGSDTGTTECSTLVEKEATLQIANKLNELLAPTGARVVFTRTTDVDMGNTERANVANNENADVLVSVHLNGSTNHSVNYTQGLYGKKSKDYKFTKVIHDAQVAALVYQDSGVTDGGVTSFASGVLLKSNMPATITEGVFLSNTVECQKLTEGVTSGNMQRQTEIAQSIYNGLQTWFQQLSDGSGGGSGPGKGKPNR